MVRLYGIHEHIKKHVSHKHLSTLPGQAHKLVSTKQLNRFFCLVFCGVFFVFCFWGGRWLLYFLVPGNMLKLLSIDYRCSGKRLGQKTAEYSFNTKRFVLFVCLFVYTHDLHYLWHYFSKILITAVWSEIEI